MLLGFMAMAMAIKKYWWDVEQQQQQQQQQQVNDNCIAIVIFLDTK